MSVPIYIRQSVDNTCFLAALCASFNLPYLQLLSSYVRQDEKYTALYIASWLAEHGWHRAARALYALDFQHPRELQGDEEGVLIVARSDGGHAISLFRVEGCPYVLENTINSTGAPECLSVYLVRNGFTPILCITEL
jgi:hypothetical protein